MNDWSTTFGTVSLAIIIVAVALLVFVSVLSIRIFRLVSTTLHYVSVSQAETREMVRRVEVSVQNGLGILAEEIRDAIKKRADPF